MNGGGKQREIKKVPYPNLTLVGHRLQTLPSSAEEGSLYEPLHIK